MSKNNANLRKLNDSAFAIIGDDGLTNFGLVRGSDGSALLIDADIRRMDEIDDGLQRAGCTRVKYLLNTHENFDHRSANHYFEKNGAVHRQRWLLGSEAYKAAFAEFRAYLSDFHQRLLEMKAGKIAPGEVETHMKSGSYAQMGKTYMVKRNIEYFLKQGVA